MSAGARRATRPFALFIGGNQTRLRLEPRDIGPIIRIPELIDEGARTGEFRIAVNQDQSRIQPHSLRINPVVCAFGRRTDDRQS